jgi:hypothetical protein
MSRFLNVLWVLVLAGSLIALAVGYFSGRSFGSVALAQLHPPPPHAPVNDAVARDFARELHGAHSLDEAGDPRDEYDEAEDAVAARPDGWAPPTFDPQRERARVALVVVDAGIAGAPAEAFLNSPVPFTLVVPASERNPAVQAARAAGKAVVVDAAGVVPATIRARIQAGAIGVLSDATGQRAREVARAAGPAGIVLDPLLGDDGASYRIAREANLAACTRDVIADGRDTDVLMDTLFGAALLRAERTGVAIVFLHARPHSLAAAERFTVRAARDGVDVVPLDRVVGRTDGSIRLTEFIRRRSVSISLSSHSSRRLARFTFHASTDRRRRSRTVSTSSIGQILRSPRCGFPFCISRPSESPRHSARRRAHVCRRLEDRAPTEAPPNAPPATSTPLSASGASR